jgi:hypothetical protein
MRIGRRNLILAVVAAVLATALVVVKVRERARTREWRNLPPPMSWLSKQAPARPFGITLPNLDVMPYDLRQLGLASSGDPDEVGRIEGAKVSAGEVDEQSRGAVRRLGESVGPARRKALLWLAERNALEFEAMRAEQPLVEVLFQAYHSIPAPTAADLDAMAPKAGLSNADEETFAAARSQWRLQKWQVKRSQIIEVGHLAHPITLAGRASSDGGAPVDDGTAAWLGKRRVTRDELLSLAGLDDYKARVNYVEEAGRAFDELVTQAALKKEAGRLELPIEELYARSLKEYPPVSEAELQDYLRKEPGFLKRPGGKALARAHLELARGPRARAALETQLRAKAVRELRVKTPAAPRFAFEAVRPLEVGPKDARVTVVALHSFGVQTAHGFAAELSWLMDDYGENVRIVYLPHYPKAEAIVPYRAALALYCAQEQGRFREYFDKLRFEMMRASVSDLSAMAQRAGLDQGKFRECLLEDRYLPLVIENRLLADRAGLSAGEPALFIDGQFIQGFSDRTRVAAIIDKALGRQAAAPGPPRDGGVAVAARPPMDAAAAASRPAGDGGAGPTVSDPVAADLQAMIDKAKAVASAAGKAPGAPRSDAGLADRRTLIKAAAENARKMAEVFGSYKAFTPEVQALSREANIAWKSYAEAMERVATVTESDQIEAAQLDLDKARRKMGESMARIASIARARGLGAGSR